MRVGWHTVRGMSGPLAIPRILLTVVALWLAIVPPVVDLTPTHVFHPDWTGHARFHMMWLLGVNSSLAILALYLLWAPAVGEAARTRLRLAGLLEVIILGAFFAAAATLGTYGGKLADAQGGVPPLPGGIDANVALFSVLLVMTIVGLWRSRSRTDA